MSLALHRWLWLAQLRARPGRFALSALAIAIGVALALAIHLVNRSALAEFDSALASINGEAQARIEGRSGSLDETLWGQIARSPAIAAASPVIEADFRVVPVGDDGRAPLVPSPGPVAAPTGPLLRVIGIDPMRAALVTPLLLPASGGAGAASDLFAADAIFLSRHALELTGRQPGDPLVLQTAQGPVNLRIAGTLDRIPAGVALAVMDIGTMQWRLSWLGRLSRIDLQLAAGVPLASLTGTPARVLAGPGLLELPPDLIVTTPDASQRRMSNLSRAYRVNLGVLALVALFTGGFIVHATVALAVAHERPRLALLGVLGGSRGLLLRQVLGLGLLPGVAGALLGVAAGLAGARLLLAAVGGDLGGGYFGDRGTPLAADPIALLGFGLAGVAIALAGSLAAAIRVARQAPARALGPGAAGREPPPRGLATVLLPAGLGALLLALPPVAGLPLPAYLAIALWLLAGIALLPRLLPRLRRFLEHDAIARAGPAAWLAAQRVATDPTATGAALGGIVAALALAGAMAIMVGSFRTSVGQWLDGMLPADLYGRIVEAGPNDGIAPAAQARIATLHGVARTEFLHASRLLLDPVRPAVALLARPVDARAPQERLPLTGRSLPAPAGTIPIWVSEAVVDLYGWRTGQRVSLPLSLPEPFPRSTSGSSPTQPDADDKSFFVAGVWRDYARQHGAIVIALSDWRALGGPDRVTDLSLWLEPGTPIETIADRIQALAGDDPADGGPALQLRSAAELRAVSLRIFDRSFAATWALEAVAIAVALFGAATLWSTEALARRDEFATLYRLGARPLAITTQFALEAGILVAAATAWGLTLGAAIALVLIHRVNPQSFHWTMDVHWPLAQLAVAGVAVVALAVLAAGLTAWRAGGASALSAREDG